MKHPALRAAATVFNPVSRISETLRLILPGVFEHHPDLKVAFTEGCYWHRQCATTFMYDPTALRIMDVLWSLDYPHTESVHGFAGEIAKDIWTKLGPADAAKVLDGNAAWIWGLGR